MRNLSTKTKVVAVAAVGGALAMSGVAYAYWTTTGSGTGSATAGSDIAADKIQLTQVGTLTGFYPGSTPQSVRVKATNPAAFSQKDGNVTVSVAAVGSCAADNWTVSDSGDSFGTLAAGATSAAEGQAVATIQLRESGANQDACKGVSPVLTFASAPGA
jgi:hypothetical protein